MLILQPYCRLARLQAWLHTDSHGQLAHLDSPAFERTPRELRRNGGVNWDAIVGETVMKRAPTLRGFSGARWSLPAACEGEFLGGHLIMLFESTIESAM